MRVVWWQKSDPIPSAWKMLPTQVLPITSMSRVFSEDRYCMVTFHGKASMTFSENDTMWKIRGLCSVSAPVALLRSIWNQDDLVGSRYKPKQNCQDFYGGCATKSSSRLTILMAVKSSALYTWIRTVFKLCRISCTSSCKFYYGTSWRFFSALFYLSAWSALRSSKRKTVISYIQAPRIVTEDMVYSSLSGYRRIAWLTDLENTELLTIFVMTRSDRFNPSKHSIPGTSHTLGSSNPLFSSKVFD